MARRSSAFQVKTPSERIPVVINGEKKYVEPSDLVLSGAEQDELANNRADIAHQGLIQRLVKQIYDNAAHFAFGSLMEMMPSHIYEAESRAPADAWLDEHGFEVQQDGLTTILRMQIDGNMRVVRTLVASVETQYEEDVIEWIRRDGRRTITKP